MESTLTELEQLQLVSKICSELENHLGFSDKTLGMSIYSWQLSDTWEGLFSHKRKACNVSLLYLGICIKHNRSRVDGYSMYIYDV